MKITEKAYKWKGALSSRPSTEYIILHHRAASGDVDSIHTTHLANGWTGIGYHFYVRKDGSVYRGRPINSIGAHCTGRNSNSVGICFEGNFQTETMLTAQLNSGRELIEYLKDLYPKAEIKRHSDFSATACPGTHFPFDEMKTGKAKRKLTTANEITWELNFAYFPIDDIPRFVEALDKAKAENSSLYWGYYKLVNKE